MGFRFSFFSWFRTRISEDMGLFFSKYKILPPLLGFILGILLEEWVGDGWLLISILSPVFGAISIFRPQLIFLVFIPLGILFSAKTVLPENHVSHFTEERIDVEGVVFRSPESRERGSRFFIDVKSVFIKGEEKEVSGRVIITSEERMVGVGYGDRIRVIGTKLRPIKNFKNPGGFDVKGYYERQGIYATGLVPGDEQVISFGRDNSSNFFIHYLDKLRGRFGQFVRDKTAFPESEIINAVVIGDQGGLPPHLRNLFSEAGIAHLLSISGLHVGSVALVFYVLTKWVLKRSRYLLLRFQVPRLAAAFTIIPIFLYTAIAGFDHPVVRAFIMASVYLVSVVAGRDENKFNTLGVAAFIILLWHPGALFELSFQLSFGSVLGILLMHRFYPFKLNTFKNKFLTSVKTTAAASFVTLPLIINSFGVLPLVSIPANLIFVPVVEFLVVPVGLLSFLAFLLSGVLAGALLFVDVMLIKSILWGTERLLSIPLSSLTIPYVKMSSWFFYALVLIPLLLWKIHPRLRFILPLCIVGFIATAGYGFLNKPNRGLLEVNFLDAGERNIVFARLPQERTILIDGGFSYYERGGYIERSVVIPFVLESGSTRIDYLILTSLDKDHLEGAKSLLQKLKVERIWTNGSRLDGKLWEIIREKRVSWKNMLDDVETFEIEGVRLDFIKPRGKFEIKDSSIPYPLLLKLTFGRVSFIFGEGIAEDAVQTELLEIYRERIASSVIYLPGIYGIRAMDFIYSVSPKVMVTSRYPSFLTRFRGAKNQGMRVMPTDIYGNVTVLTDGIGIRVKTFM